MDGMYVLLPLNAIILFIRRYWKVVILCIAVSLTTLLLSTMVSIWLSRFHNLRLPSLGTIRAIGVEVYSGDLDGTQINWGIVYPGTLTNRSLYIRSESNVPVTLSLKQSNFMLINSKGENVTGHLPLPATEALNLTWNYSGIVLDHEQVIFVTLTLKVSGDLGFIKFLVNYGVVEFNFDIHIEAKPVE
ncbi:MAG: hypothetical protein QXU46_01350 [Candidatus Bathyarchaeia archaeon]